MKTLDYDFYEYQSEFNKTAGKILKESFEDGYDADAVSDQIDEAQVTYNKIQKILNTPEMIKSHAYLYALDMENVDECDKVKVDKLYELGKARGVIKEDEPEQKDNEGEVTECGDETGAICGGPDDSLSNQQMTPGETKPVMGSSAFTVLYSAMKDGEIKTGEYFSSATDAEAAKADCISNLTPLGYSSIRVLGIEKKNTAVDMANSDLGHLSEDDSKEFEDQETGAGDTTDDAGKDEQKADDTQKADNTQKQDDGTEKKDDTTKTDDAGAEEKKDDAEQKDDAEKTDEPKKLTPTEKQTLRDEYVGMFKAELQKTGLEKSVEEMSIKEKAAFWKAISEKWTKQEPEEFMSDKEIEKLYTTVLKN